MVYCASLSRSARHRLCRILFIGSVAVVWFGTLLSIGASGLQPEPQRAIDPLAANIDTSVSPRDDFYLYANGNWLKRNPLPDNAARWSIGSVISESIYEELRQISESAAAARAPRGSAARLIGDVWATGMNAEAINNDGLRHLRPDLARIDRIASPGDVIDVVAALHRRNMLADNYFTRQRVLFDGGLSEDEASGRWTFLLAQGGLSIGAAAYTGNGPEQIRRRTALREYLVRTFVSTRRRRRQSHGSGRVGIRPRGTACVRDRRR